METAQIATTEFATFDKQVTIFRKKYRRKAMYDYKFETAKGDKRMLVTEQVASISESRNGL